MAIIHPPKDLNPLPETLIFDKLFKIACYSGLEFSQAMEMPAELQNQFETIACIGWAGVYVSYSLEDLNEKSELSEVNYRSKEHEAIKSKYIEKRKIKRNNVLNDLEDIVSVMTAGKNIDDYNAYEAMKLLTEALELVEFTAPILRTCVDIIEEDSSDGDLSFHPRRV